MRRNGRVRNTKKELGYLQPGIIVRPAVSSSE